jgi:hypothetical protein
MSGIIKILHTLTPTLLEAPPLTAPQQDQLVNKHSPQTLLSVDSPTGALSAPGFR